MRLLQALLQTVALGSGRHRRRTSRTYRVPADVLPSLPQGSDVFLDANIFIYAFGRQSQQCHDLLARCAREEVFGITTLGVINEVTHRMMLSEAVATEVITRENARDLKGKHQAIQGLTQYWPQTTRIFGLNLLILSSDQPRLHRAQTVRSSHGLLTNDSLIIAAMDEYGILYLASRDDDFDHLAGVTVFKPTDLP